jgi:hypothetical protein
MTLNMAFSPRRSRSKSRREFAIAQAHLRARARSRSSVFSNFCLPQVRLPPAERQSFIYVSVAIRSIERELKVSD